MFEFVVKWRKDVYKRQNLENLKDVENQPNYTFVKANICDSAAITKIFDENDIDRVVHFAAESHVDRSIKNPEVFVKTNVLGTLVMLNAAKAACCLLYTSRCV